MKAEDLEPGLRLDAVMAKEVMGFKWTGAGNWCPPGRTLGSFRTFHPSQCLDEAWEVHREMLRQEEGRRERYVLELERSDVLLQAAHEAAFGICRSAAIAMS